MTRVGIALVGAGPWGRTLGQAFAQVPGADLRWICELDAARRVRAAEAHPNARSTADLSEVLDDPGVAAVAVAAEPEWHHDLGLRVLEANRHLHVEKPMALSSNDARSLNAAAQERARVLSVGHLLLHHPAVRRARQIIASGALGDSLCFESTRETIGAPRVPGSAWWALAPHDVSTAIDLFGAMPVSVRATGGAFAGPDQDGVATAALTFSDGRTAHVRVGRYASVKTRRTSIAGKQGTLTFDELAPDHRLLLLTPGMTAPQPIPIDDVDVLSAQCAHFVSCVRRGDPAGGNGEHGVSVTRVLEAGARSMRESGAAVVPA